jgi:hypothetical protein
MDAKVSRDQFVHVPHTKQPPTILARLLRYTVRAGPLTTRLNVLYSAMSSEAGGAVPPVAVVEAVEGSEEILGEGGEKISKSEFKRRAKAAAVAEEKAAKAAARAEAAAAKGPSTGGGGGGPPVEEEILDPSKCVCNLA